MEKVDAILAAADIPDRHSFFQIEKFIIGKEVTGQAQLWAIVRELRARRETVEQHHRDLSDAEDNLELLEIKVHRAERMIRRLAEDKDGSGPDQDLNIQELEINIRKLQREKESLIAAARKATKRLRSVVEEINYLAAGYEQIVEKVGGMKPFDDEASQKEMWNERLLEDFNLRAILQRPLDPEFVKTVLSLHDDAPVKKQVVAIVENIQKKMIADKRAVAPRPAVEVRPKVTGK
jgi:hypothetical protein